MDGKARKWVDSIAVGFLCVAAAATFAMAGSHPAPQPQAATRAESSSAYVPPGMHEAQADKDVGPGCDEAQLVTSSWGE